MSVISEIIIAKTEQVDNLAQSVNPSQSFSGIISTGILNAEISVLYSILLGEEWNEKHLESIEQVYEGSEEGPWIFVFPDKLGTKLANLTKEDLASAVQKWGQSEEFLLKGYGEDESRFLLENLQRLAKEAHRETLKMYLFLAL